MAYSYLSFAAAQSILAGRLQDPNLTYWNQPNELLNCIIESLRLFQTLTGFYKQKVTFQTTKNVNYYDITSTALTGANSPVGYNATDVEVINNVLAALLEPPITYPAWTGTGQFTLAQLQNALQNRLNRFLGDTGCRVVQQTIQAPGPPADIITLPDTVLDVRRVAWISPSGGLTWADLMTAWQNVNAEWIGGTLAFPLGRMDDWAAQAYVPQSQQNPGLPKNYSIFGIPLTSVRVIPPPLNEGLTDCLFVESGPQLLLNPASPVVLNLPDDLSPALKWGVLADLLGSDGPSRDYARATYCEQRYREFVQASLIYPSMLTADINNITSGSGSVYDMDNYLPNWQQTSGLPTFVGLCGRNLACVGQTPDQGPYGVGMWVSANSPVSTASSAPSTTYLQIGRDQIDPVLDYAQHIASFKMGGAEFEGTQRMMDNFVACAKQQNGRLSAVSFYKGRMQGQAVRSEESMSRIVVSGA